MTTTSSEALRLSKAIDPARWRWYGTAAHLIVGSDCRFHLATEIGRYMVSTVGQYLPDSQVREISANSRGVTLEGRGDAREADYMKKIGYEQIGYDRLFETLVFKLGRGRCQAVDNCGLPNVTDWGELDSAAYNTVGDATRGHYAMCRKWARAHLKAG